MKNKLIIIIVIVAIIVAIFFIKKKLNEISFEFFDVKIISLTDKELKGSFTLSINQPFGKVTVLSTNLKVYADDIFLTTITLNKPVFELINNKLQLDLAFNVDVKKTLSLKNIVTLLQNAGSNNIRIEGEATIKKLGLKTTVPVTYTGKI